jgi:serine/threonine-protein kinase HipA
MTSERAFVWVTLPGRSTPTLAGLLEVDANGGSFVYGRSYLGNPDAVPLDPVQLRLVEQVHQIAPDHNAGLPGAIRDASPDHWGRYLLGAFRGAGVSEVALLLGSPDDRVGALSFSPAANVPPAQPRPAPTTEALEELGAAVLRQEEELGPWTAGTAARVSPRGLAMVDRARTSLGGARPKMTVLEDGALWLAKAGRPDDGFDFPRAEAAMLDLARLCGIETPEASVRRFGRRDALLVRRFDREVLDEGVVARTRFCSALCCLQADEGDQGGRSYLRLADEVTRRIGRPGDGPELFRRMVLNALINNCDDHLRNHGVIAAGTGWRLSPVYDLVPAPSVSHEVHLALRVGDDGDRAVTIPKLVACSGRFGLRGPEAAATISTMVAIVGRHWDACLRGRGVNETQIGYLRQAFLKPGLGIAEAGLPDPGILGASRPTVVSHAPDHAAPKADAARAAAPEEPGALLVTKGELGAALAHMRGEPSEERDGRDEDRPTRAVVVHALVANRERLRFSLHDDGRDRRAPGTTYAGIEAIETLLNGFGQRRFRRLWLDAPTSMAGASEAAARALAAARAATASRRLTVAEPGPQRAKPSARGRGASPDGSDRR